MCHDSLMNNDTEKLSLKSTRQSRPGTPGGAASSVLERVERLEGCVDFERVLFCEILKLKILKELEKSLKFLFFWFSPLSSCIFADGKKLHIFLCTSRIRLLISYRLGRCAACYILGTCKIARYSTDRVITVVVLICPRRWKVRGPAFIT